MRLDILSSRTTLHPHQSTHWNATIYQHSQKGICVSRKSILNKILCLQAHQKQQNCWQTISKPLIC